MEEIIQPGLSFCTAPIQRARPPATSSSLLELCKAEEILLRFGRELRNIAHNCTTNVTRLHVWSDCSAVTKEAARQATVVQHLEKQALERIYCSLPSDTSASLLPGGGAALRLRLAHTSRQWKPAETLKLKDLVIETLVQELIASRVNAVKGSDPGRDDETRRLYRQEIQSASDYGSQTWISKLFTQVDEMLDAKALSDSSYEISSFWKFFWDRIAVDVSSSGSINAARSGRECHMHWLHFLDPHVNRDPEWTKQEETMILTAVEELGGGKWAEVAKRLGTNRTAFSVYRHYQTALNVNLCSKEWTPENEKLLVDLVERYKGERTRIWFKVSAHFPDKSNEQCRARYEKVLRDTARQGHWLCEEDLRLQILVNFFGRGFWSKVAEHMPFRTDMKCRERYENLLAPELQKAKWSTAENMKLLDVVKELGPGPWSRVQERMPGRTDSECAKQWARLDPMGALSEGGLRAVRCMFIPKQQKQRQNRASLDDRDFQLDIAAQLDQLLGASIRAKPYVCTGHTVGKRKLSRYSAANTSRLKLTDGSSASTAIVNVEPTLASENFSIGEMNVSRRMGLLRCFLENLTTGHADADAQLNNVKRVILRKREIAYGLPCAAADLVPPSSEEEALIKDLVSAGIPLSDIVPGEGPLMSDPRFATEAAQATIALLAHEINGDMFADTSTAEERPGSVSMLPLIPPPTPAARNTQTALIAAEAVAQRGWEGLD